ncbi:CoA pyrophosphatase [Dermatophilaceae bacterium Soc4.6]
MSPTPTLARHGESLRPYAAPPGAPPLAHPAYLDTLMAAAAQVDPEFFSRFLPPDDDDGLRQSSVLLLFGPDADGVDSVLLTERSHTMRSHPGQISLPGGGADPVDTDVVATALREAYEEVLLDPAGVEVLGTLPALFLPPSGHVVTTVVGWWREPSPVGVGDPGEVATVILAPVSHLTDPAVRHTVVHPSGYSGPAVDLGDDLLLWGFTAGLVTKALTLAGLERPWDRGDTRPLPDRFTWRR